MDGYEIIESIASGDSTPVTLPPLIQELFANNYFFAVWNKSDEELEHLTRKYGNLHPVSRMLLIMNTIVGWKVLAAYASEHDLLNIVSSGLVTNRMLNLIIATLHSRGNDELAKRVQRAARYESVMFDSLIYDKVIEYSTSIHTLKQLHSTSEEYRRILDDPDTLAKMAEVAAKEGYPITGPYDEEDEEDRHQPKLRYENFQDYLKWYADMYYSEYCDFKNDRGCLDGALHKDDLVMFKKIVSSHGGVDKLPEINRTVLLGRIWHSSEIANYIISETTDNTRALLLSIVFKSSREITQVMRDRSIDTNNGKLLTEIVIQLYYRKDRDNDVKKKVKGMVTRAMGQGINVDTEMFLNNFSRNYTVKNALWMRDIALLILNGKVIGIRYSSVLIVLGLFTLAQYIIRDPRSLLNNQISSIMTNLTSSSYFKADSHNVRRLLLFLLPVIPKGRFRNMTGRSRDQYASESYIYALIDEAVEEYKLSDMASISIPLLS